ncbi:hypothetical protein BGZ72_004569 [Mortierella alpina]|nr:hypothetical protein BGZ72_004569 [Mortierella alpina]
MVRNNTSRKSKRSIKPSASSIVATSTASSAEQYNQNGHVNNHDQTQSTNVTVVEDEIYYSDSDPEAAIPDVYGDDSDGDGEGEDGDVYSDVYSGDTLPDLLPDDIYHPEHPTVRQHINELFQKTLTASANPPINAPQLVDRLVRQHLPQFWRHRFQDIDLNKYRDMECSNDRPRSLAILSTCVECGFKFCKQPLYDDTQRQRHCARLKREKAGKRISGRRPSRKRRPILGAEYFFRRQGTSSSSGPGSGSGEHDNSGLTATEIDNVLNNSRRSTRFDGNLDHIGLKEEMHDNKCLHNKTSAKLNVRKIYMGWGLVPGHDHVTTPPYHQVPPTSLLPAASASINITATSRSSLPTASTFAADALTEDDMIPLLPESDCLLYPSRSLMASFCHLIPRGLVFSNNMLRKLFTYFVWHPWFDCHLQAITIRRAYSELWPIFLLSDEDDEVDDEEVAEFRNQMNALNRARRQVAQERKKLEIQADPQTGSKRKFNDETENKKRKKTKNDDVTGAHEKGKGKHKRKGKDKNKNKNKNMGCPVSDEDDTTPSKVRKPRSAEERATFERARLISLQARFTTSFKNGLSIHGIRSESVYPPMNIRARIARQQRKGWTVFGTLPPSPAPGSIPSQPYVIDDDNNGESNTYNDCDEKELFARRKIPFYIADVDEKVRTSANGVVHPETPFPDLPEDTVLRLTNHPLTQPGRKDALSQLAARLSSWFRRAHRRRVRQGFILPEYMLLRPPKVKPQRKTKTQPESKPKSKPEPKPRTKTKTKANACSSKNTLMPDPIMEEQAVIAEPEKLIDAEELVNYLTQPWAVALAPRGGPASSSAQNSLAVRVTRRSPRGLNARLNLQGLDTSSLSLIAASSTTQRVHGSEDFIDSFGTLAVHSADSAGQSMLHYRDESQLYGLMFDDVLDYPFPPTDSYSWSSGYGVDSAIPDDLMAIDLGEENVDLDMGCFEEGQGTSDP